MKKFAILCFSALLCVGLVAQTPQKKKDCCQKAKTECCQKADCKQKCDKQQAKCDSCKQKCGSCKQKCDGKQQAKCGTCKQKCSSKKQCSK